MSRIITKRTTFQELERIRRALDALGVPYHPNGPVPGVGAPAAIAISGAAFDHWRGIGYRRRNDEIQRVMDDEDLTGSGEPIARIAAFERRVQDAYNLTLIRERLDASAAAGLTYAEETLADGTVIITVNDPLHGVLPDFAEALI